MASDLTSWLNGAEPAFTFLLFLPFVVAVIGVGAWLVQRGRKGG